MADDTRDSASPAPAIQALHPPKKDSKGIILGPDGKPCRTCNTLTSFLGAKSSTLKAVPSKDDEAARYPADCPPDVEQLGRASWTLLHSIAATYPATAPAALQAETTGFIRSFGRLYPCWSCAEDFQRWIAEQGGVRAGGRQELGMWLCEAHNEVNRKLGKREFDCARWEERWRTGWRDGRCG
ncbi:augmenter of liver regeneration [Bisporella sp. PMI_857]|nr:augmenter of liver regeneration [Bisporella sp. PMI_857]